MIPFSIVSVVALLGFMGTASLAVLFYIVYWTLGRHTVELLLANVLACSAAVCLGMFLMSIQVPMGAEVRDPRAAASTIMMWLRLNFMVGWISIVVFPHFVLRYCKSRNWMARHIWVLYACVALAMQTTWSPLFWEGVREPRAVTGQWMGPLPWVPRPGPLLLPFVCLWLASQVYAQFILWRRRTAAEDSDDGPLRTIGLVRLALVVQAAGATFDAVAMGPIFLFTFPLLPLTSVTMAVLLTVAIVQARIQQERRRHELGRELELAGEIQRGLLPRESPRIPGFELAGWSQSAAQTGGDIYDFLELPDGRWMIVVADASGHGMGPALMVAETRTVLRSICLRCSDPAEVLIEANHFLALDFTSGRFVTCFLGFLDPPSASLSYASAGQGPVILYGQATGRFDVQGATGPPLAVVSGSGFHAEVSTRHLGHGDFVALVSDGFYESSNPAGEQFGMERLMDALRDNKHRPAAEIVARAREQLARFTQSSQPLDDCTFVVLRAQ